MNTKTMAAALNRTPIQKHALERIRPSQLPQWAQGKFKNEPTNGRISLANLPTPLYRIHSNGEKESIVQQLAQNDIALYVKRDDMSGGVELGGNKVRKLEFLLADALKKGCDSVVTIGGEQSNHCRATAAAARQVGMEPHLILRTKRAQAVQEGREEFGVVGNILFDRIVGSTIYTCTPGEYGRLGSNALVQGLCQHLTSAKNLNPYAIPVGGSNGLGSFGYVVAVEELLAQWNGLQEDDDNPSLDHVVFACGSGGTAAGIVLGMALAALAEGKQPQTMPTIHAIGVCDSPDYFYGFVAGIADEMGIVLPEEGASTEEFIRQHLTVHQGKGLGYALSTEEELEFVGRFAMDTGIALDPVYSGKALYNFVTEVVLPKKEASSFQGKNLLFWHTGGALGLFEKEDALLQRLKIRSPVRRLDVYGKDNMEGGVDISSSVKK